MLGSDAWQLEQGLRMQDSHEHLHALTCFFFQILHPPFRIIIHFESLTNVWISAKIGLDILLLAGFSGAMHVGSLVHSADSYELRMNYV
jgi:hypothetical protein